MLELRQYQKECVDTIFKLLPMNDTILIQAATGAGKTIIFSALTKKLLSQWPNLKICVVVHIKEVVNQNLSKMQEVFGPFDDDKIGVACSSIQTKKEIDKPIIIGSIQTLSRIEDDLNKINLLIIDEAHRVPPINKNNSYSKFINKLKSQNNKLKIIGFTATPYRLGHGYIYGEYKKEENENLFKKLSYSIGTDKLINDDFLCKYKMKCTKNIEESLNSLSNRTEYNLAEIESIMATSVNIESVHNTILNYAKDRKSILIFCTTILHAEILNKFLKSKDHKSEVMHSKIHKNLNSITLEKFKEEEIRIICNVGMLTEGFDNPKIDCILLCRPTKSASLYVQMIGRGLRTHPDKQNLLILDLSNNCIAHGDIGDPVVTVPNIKFKANKDPVVKICDKCFEIISVGYRKCPECSFEFPKKAKAINEDKNPELHNYDPKNTNIEVTIEDSVIENYTSKAGNTMLKIGLLCKSKSGETIRVNEFLDIEGNASKYGCFKSKKFWNDVVQTKIPKTVDEMYERNGEIFMSLPDAITIKEKNGWWNVKKWST